MIKTYRLSNGMQVIIEDMPYLRSVAFGLWVKTGSAYENEANNGIAHLIEHMLFKGTSNHSAKELADMMTAIGGNLNAFTAKECTSFYVRTLDIHLEKAIEIIGDMICNSLFLPKDISKEKQVVLDEIDMYNDSPEDLVHELLQKKVWDKHPLGYIISGSKKNVKSFKQRDISDFFNDNYTADNMVISIAGHCDVERILDVLEKHFGGIKAASGIRHKISKPTYKKVFVKKHKDIEQVHLNVAFDSVGYQSDDRYTLSIANAILGGSLNSRLFQHIREELGLTYSIYSYESLYRDTGLFHIYAAMNPSQLEYVFDEIRLLVKHFVLDGITARELEDTKEQLVTEYILGLESTNFRMENNAKYLLLQENCVTLDEITDKIKSVSMDDVKNYLERYVDMDNASVCVVGNMNEININNIMEVRK